MNPLQFLLGKVGQATAAVGSFAQLRLSKLCALIVSNVLGRYAESTLNNHTFFVSTGVGGVAPGTALGTTPPMVIWNPPGNLFMLSVNQVRFGYISGTLGAGTLCYAFAPLADTPSIAGTALTPVPGNLGRAKPSFSAWQGPTLAAAPSLLGPGIGIAAGTAATAALPGAAAVDEIDGSIMIPPGMALCIQEIGAAGTAPLGMIGVHLEEVPIP